MRRVPCRSLLVAVVSTGLVATAGVCAAPVARAAGNASVTLTGARASATRVPFQISGEMSASVDVGTGNLMVSTTDLKVPTVNGGLQPLGLAFNSLALQDGSAAKSGEAGTGWFMPYGRDNRLISNDDGSVLFMSTDSQQGLFKPASGGGYTPPSTMNKTLTKNSDGTWTVFDPAARQTMKFGADGRLASIKDRSGNTTTFDHHAKTDDLAEYMTITTPSGDEVKVRYDDKGRIMSMSGAAPGPVTPPTTEFGYDGDGHLTSITRVGPRPNVGPGTSTRTTVAKFYWMGGNLESINDGEGNVTKFTYDSDHRVTEVLQGRDATSTTDSADLASTRFDYVSDTQTDVADPDSDQSKDVPDVAHTVYTVGSSTKLVSKATDPLGHGQSATYTPFNNVASATNGTGGKTANTYGANGGHSVTQSTSPTGAGASASYGSGNNAYNVTNSTDAQGNSSVMAYDSSGRGTSTSTSGGAKASVAYHDDGTLKSSTDPGGDTKTYTEDTNQKYITKITPPATSALGPTTISGVPATSITNGAGQATNYKYDWYNQYQLDESSSSDVKVSYEYDKDDRMTSRTDKNQKVAYTYDVRGNLASVATTPVAAGAPPASTINYGYDKAGNMTTRTISGQVTKYGYDAANRLTSMTTPDGQVTRFGYDSNDHRTDTWWHTNADNSTFQARTHNEFDKSGRITRTWTTVAKTGSTHIFDSSYSYTKSGKDTGLVQSITDARATTNKTATLGYDSQNRLTSATNWHGHDYKYTYDASGNRTSSSVDGTKTSLKFNSDDEITSTGYAYDKAGRRTKDPHGGTMTYNSAGQMTKQVVGSNTGSFMYAGDSQDELIQQKTNAGAINYVYGRANQAGVPVLEQDTLPGSSTPVTFNNDPAGQPIDATQDGKDLYLVYDGLGQFIATTLPDGTQNGTNLQLDPWGNWVGSDSAAAKVKTQGKVLSRVNAAAAGNASPWTTLGIADTVVTDGTWWKRGTRYNDTITGTWTSIDPITWLNNPNRSNPYTYTGDDPINNFDPAGRWSLSFDVSACAIVCVKGGVSVNDDGSVHPSVGLGAGADFGVSAGPSVSTADASSGWSSSVSCNVGPAGVTGTVGGGLSGSYTPGGGGAGCEASESYTW